MTHHRRLAETAMRPWPPMFIDGDLQVDHVFVDGDHGTDVDIDLIHAWWSWRCLVVVRWPTESGYGSPNEFPEVVMLRSRS